jgi:hypothetical protein
MRLLLICIALVSFGNVIAGELELNIVNYNIKGLPLPWLKHSPRYKHIGKSLATHFRIENSVPDIIGLQEAFHRKTALVGDQLKYPQRITGPKGKGLRISAGLETMTSMNVIGINQIVFQRCASWDCLSRKGVLHTRLAHKDLPFNIDVYNTHLQADPSSDPITPIRITQNIRTEQALKMMQFVQETHDPKNLLIMIGDFNFKQSSTIYPWFVSLLQLKDTAYLCSFVEVCAGSADPLGYWLGLIDHQFFRLPQGREVSMTPTYFNKILNDPTEGKVLSDHDAVVMKYLIKWQ